MIDKQYLKDLASRRSEHGLVLTACLSTSRLDDWKQMAPTFLKSDSTDLGASRCPPKKRSGG